MSWNKWQRVLIAGSVLAGTAAGGVIARGQFAGGRAANASPQDSGSETTPSTSDGRLQPAMFSGKPELGGVVAILTGFQGMGFGGGARDPELEKRVHEARPKLFRALDAHPRTLAIVAKLNEVHDFPFANETPLEEVIKYLRAETKDDKLPNGIPIYVDPAGLQEAEKTLQSPVHIELEGVRLRTALRLALKQLDLVYVVKEGILMISSPTSQDFLDEIERDPEEG